MNSSMSMDSGSMESNMTTTPTAAQMASYQLFLQCTSGAPEGANLYSYCAHQIRYFLQPPAYSWVPSLLIALSALYALLCLTFAGLLVLRARWGQFWLFRRETTAFGTVLTAHTINFTCVMSCLYFGLGLGTIWTSYQVATIDSVDRLVASQMFSGLSYLPIWTYAWADACSIFLNLANWRGQPVRQHGSKRAMAYNVVAVGVPVGVVVFLCVAFSQMAMQGMQPTVSAANIMRDWLINVCAPMWMGTVEAHDLTPLLPTAIQLLNGAMQFDHWQRVAFGFWIGAVGILYAVWIPLVVLHVKQLLGQIKMLRGTMGTFTRTRQSPSVNSDKLVPTYVLGEKSVSSARPQVDEAENRIRWLLRVCIFRVAAAIVITAGIAVFASIIFLVVIDPRGAASNQSKNFYCRIGALFVPIVLSLPGLLTAMQHPRQAPAPMRGNDVWSSNIESVSPWKGLGAQQTSSGASSDKASDKDDDSAIYHLPTVTASPVRLQHAAQHVMVEVETVVHSESA